MDRHFVETNPRHNVPILLALTDIWNETLSNTDGRIISPFAEAFAAFPAFCATLEAQTGVNGMVVDGGLHHSYDKALYQADRVLPSELVMTMDSQTTFNTSPTDGLSTMTDEVHAAQDMLICSVFAHADELAFGKDSKGTETLANHISREATRKASNEGVTDGNRPNTLLICDRCDAFACGQLVALAEHRAVVKARILDIDPFEKEIGSSLRVKRTKVLKEGLDKMFLKLSDGDELDEEGLEITDGGQPVNISTRTILRHYANLMQDQRMHVTR
jgi:glucose-6-phosphate isomerase